MVEHSQIADPNGVRLLRGPRETRSIAPTQGGSSPDSELRTGLRVFALVIGLVCVGSYAVQLLLELGLGALDWARWDWIRETTEAIVQGSLAVLVWLCARRTEWTPRQRRAVALVLYFVFVSVSTAYDAYYLDTRRFSIYPSWICLIVFMYGMLVPAKVRHHAKVAGLASAAIPLGSILMWTFDLYPATGPVVDAYRFQNVATASVTASIPVWFCAAVAIFVVNATAKKRERIQALSDRLQQLGSYELVRKLGEGGMGEVWEARHALLARPAAIKLIRPKLLTGQTQPGQEHEGLNVLLERFAREARTTAKLTSPHTVRLYDYGRTPDNTFFYAMEFLDGLDLEQLVRMHGPLPEARVRHLMLQACDSLAEAHGQGLIHRDIKPANLYVCRKGCTLDHLKVLDFGLVLDFVAPSKPTTDPDAGRLTQAGLIQGTPWYMAPEQAMSGDGLDQRVDIYALGCVAYFLLTGREVFSGQNSMAVLVQHVSHPPPPLRERNPTLHVTPAFEDLILTMLAKNRDHRPHDARTLAGLLRRLSLPSMWDQDSAETWAKEVGAWGYVAPPPADLPFAIDAQDTPTASGPLRNPEEILDGVDITRMQRPV